VLDLLLASSSRSHPGDHLDHLVDAIAAWAAGVDEVVFVPWARTDHDAYTATARTRLAHLGLRVTGLHEVDDPGATLASAPAVFVGGGNTFLLLETLRAAGVAPVLRERVASGATRYLGTSAGSNLACPTIQTTNDMPVVWPAGGPDALGLVDVQVNAHWVDADPTSTHQGETRAQRLAEYHEHHDTPVLGLREHGWLRVRGDDARVHAAPGTSSPPAVWLVAGAPPQELADGASLPRVPAGR
jgi:dipeptidase E